MEQIKNIFKLFTRSYYISRIAYLTRGGLSRPFEYYRKKVTASTCITSNVGKILIKGNIFCAIISSSAPSRTKLNYCHICCEFIMFKADNTPLVDMNITNMASQNVDVLVRHIFFSARFLSDCLI